MFLKDLLQVLECKRLCVADIESMKKVYYTNKSYPNAAREKYVLNKLEPYMNYKVLFIKSISSTIGYVCIYINKEVIS